MSAAANDHLARITAVEPPHARRVLGVGSLSVDATLLFVFHAGWTVPMLIGSVRMPLFTLGMDGYTTEIRCLALLVGIAWLAMVCCVVTVYPEWPGNRLLCGRLRKSLQARDEKLVSALDPATRVVELVPREYWRRFSFETATDLMVMRIDDEGVTMAGDWCRYELPRASILGAELVSIKPWGWVTKTHMVILYVRTAGGPVELPICYRDHWLGTLRSSSRKQQAIELAERILRIAKGHRYEPLFVDPPQPTQLWSENPYASPAI